MHELGTSKAAGSTASAAMLAGGALGTLAGGRLADVVGRKAVLLGSFALTGPLVLALLALGPGPAVALLAVLGFVSIASFSVTVVLGQELLPGRIGVASGVQLGLAIGMGGVGAALLGLVADAAGLPATLRVIAVLPLLAFILALTLPGDRPRTRRRTEARAASAPTASRADGLALDPEA